MLSVCARLLNTAWFQEVGHDFHKYANTKIIDKLSNSLANNGFKAKEERKKETKHDHPFHLPSKVMTGG